MNPVLNEANTLDVSLLCYIYQFIYNIAVFSRTLEKHDSILDGITS